jgi:sugar O-acyltransferase (sialic acid O-acetyltransferase NeuD family)
MTHREIRSVVLVGGGGHCRSLIDVIETEGKLQIAGIVDQNEALGDSLFGYPWIGIDDDLPVLARKHSYFLIAAGQIGVPNLRERLFREVDAAGGSLPVVRSPFSTVSHHSTLGRGTVVFHQAVVNAGTTIGENAILNTAALLEHDVRVGNHCHISTGARINGGCLVANRCFVGSGAVVREGVCLAEATVVGAGAVVIHNTEPFGVYVGVPARRIRSSVS